MDLLASGLCCVLASVCNFSVCLRAQGGCFEGVVGSPLREKPSLLLSACPYVFLPSFRLCVIAS